MASGPPRDFWALFYDTPAPPAPSPEPDVNAVPGSALSGHFTPGFPGTASLPPPALPGGAGVPGLAIPGAGVPGLAFAPGSAPPGPGVAGQWACTRAIGDGTGIPDPPGMPLECAVSNTGLAGYGLVAYLSWTLPAAYLGADMAVTDDAHNVWMPVGAPFASSAASGLTRCAIWACPAAFAASNVYMSPCGLPGPCYPAVMGITIIELAGMSPYLGTPGSVVSSANAATTISAPTPGPGGNAFQFAVAASDTASPPSGPGGGWTALTGVTASGGGYDLATAPAFQVSSAAQAATWTSATAGLAAASATILVSNPAPYQPSPDWPAFAFLAGLGSGALTPPGQITWTDLTSRWLAGAETVSQQGKQYELDQAQAADDHATFDDNDGWLTPDNPSSPYFPHVTADVPLRLIAWWDQRAYGVLAGFAERWPVHWDDTWYGLTDCTMTDVISLLQSQLSSVIAQEMADPGLYALWPCSDPAGSPFAQNTAPGNTNSLQVVASKNGGNGAKQSFGNSGGALPGDPSGTFWSQTGLTAGMEGYGYCLFCADQGYPLLSSGITVCGWFDPAGVTQVSNAAAQLILLRGSNAASGPAFQVWLNAPDVFPDGALNVSVWSLSTGVAVTTTIDAGNWLQAGFFHVALLLTESSWTLWLNGAPAGSGAASLPADISWLEFMGSADRQYTGSMVNGQCGWLGVYGVLLPADRLRSVYLAGTPAVLTLAGGVTQAVTGAQFGTEVAAKRIERLLGYGGWSGPRSVSQSSATQMAPITDIAGNNAVIAAGGQVTIHAGGEQAAAAVFSITFSDGGFLYVDGNGTLCYVSRGDLYAAAPQWTLGEDTAAGEIPYLPSAVLGYDKSLMWDAAQLTPSASVSGAPVVAENRPAIAAHGAYVYNGTAYQYQIAQVTDLANWIANTRAVISLRAEQVTADAMANPAVWPFLLGVQPGQPVIVWRRPQTANYTVQMFPLVTKLVKTLDFQAGTATVQAGTDQFPEGTVLTAGDPVLGAADGTHPLAW